MVLDGAGRASDATLVKTGGEACVFTVDGEPRQLPRHSYRLHIALAPTKLAGRFEWFLEKSVELGIDEITPLICDRSERRRINAARCRKILVSAMKQSMNGFLPVLNPLTEFNKVLESTADRKFICRMGVPGLVTGLRPSESCLFLVGPEGDFTDEETDSAVAGGFSPVSLGNIRLRTETAGVHVCSVMRHLESVRPG